MPRFHRIIILFILATCAATMLALPTSAHAVSVDRLERKEVALINKYRKAHHLRSIHLDKRLTKDAEWMANDMPRYNYFDHVDHLRRDPFSRLDAFRYPNNTWRGENLAAGFSDPASTFQQWVNSAPHRENILTREYKAIGMARVCNPDSTYDCYWVTEFGSRVVARLR